jgi:hypothetical protein
MDFIMAGLWVFTLIMINSEVTQFFDAFML